MSIEEADEIREQFGKFMEVGNPQLLKFFWGAIPQALLPYPKHKIDEAMAMCAEHFSKQGNDELVNVFESLRASLSMYIDDKEAISAAHERLKR